MLLLLLQLLCQQGVHGVWWSRPRIPIAARRPLQHMLLLLLLLQPVAVLPWKLLPLLLLRLPLQGRRQLLLQLLVRTAHLLPQRQDVLWQDLLVCLQLLPA
jgi:hypothetical protein